MHYIFGSWFDPFTKAHEAILKTLQKKVLTKDDKLIVCVTANDEKQNRTPVEERYALVEKDLNAKKIAHTLVVQNNRMYDFLRGDKMFKDARPSDITIVIGQDELNALLEGKWKYSQTLLHSYNFIVFYREKDGVTHYSIKDVSIRFTAFDDAELEDVSSSEVREIFRRNPECHYKDVQKHISRPVFEYIKEHQLYHQNPLNYADIEKKFIEDYKKRGWGTFANTVDILATCGDEVLLIRRKKPPYQNYWCTPGGFFDAVDMIDKETGATIKADADLEHAAQRELREETQIDAPVEKFEQIKTYSHMFDPRLRIVDTAFHVRVSAAQKKKAIGSDDAAEAAWFKIDDLPKMGFHHAQIVEDWLNTK